MNLPLRDIIESDLSKLQENYQRMIAEHQDLEARISRQLGGISYAQKLLEQIIAAENSPEESPAAESVATLDVSPSEQIDREAVSANVGEA